ncbi:MAG: hypothetical protein GF355_14175, partial [Candidatus Eisenbacteria bacterium]|nr:hypothetical protein [Candidatus Eisenbacteria bacterium]
VRDELDDLQTFQVILYDPEHHPTESGNGIIDFQYKQIVNDDYLRMYSTVGVESPTEETGLQYTYTNTYPASSAPLSSGLAIRITTDAPRYDPFRLARFAAAPEGDGVALSWAPADGRPMSGYRIYREKRDGTLTLLNSKPVGADEAGYLDRGADPGRKEVYWIGALDPVGYETRLGPFAYDPAAEELGLSLNATGGNPFRGEIGISYTIPERGRVELHLYDVSGRLVKSLVDGVQDAGRWTAAWDGTDTRGKPLASGIYFSRLRAGSEERRLKLMLMR